MEKVNEEAMYPQLSSGPSQFEVHIVSHSILRNASQFCPPSCAKELIHWTVVSGGKASQLFDIAQEIAREKRQAGISIVVGLHILQNSVKNWMDPNDFRDLRKCVRDFFNDSMRGYHRYFWIQLDRPPELCSLFPTIERINRQIEVENGANNADCCNPGRTLEKNRKGRRVIQPHKWREYLNFTGPGYHPADAAMPAYISYIRKYVSNNFYYK